MRRNSIICGRFIEYHMGGLPDFSGKPFYISFVIDGFHV